MQRLRHQLLEYYPAALDAYDDLDAPDTLELLGLAAFMRAAGISCSQRLGDLVAGLEPGGEEQAVRLLGAVRP